MTCFAKYFAIVIASLPLYLTGCADDSSNTIDPVVQQREMSVIAGSDDLIVPGQRIGPITLGMQLDQVNSIIGQNVGYVYGDAPWYPYLDLYVNPSLNTPAPVVTGICLEPWSNSNVTFGNMVWADEYHTQTPFHFTNGITLGASPYDVLRAFGQPSYSDAITMSYKYSGVSFLITTDHVVWRICVGQIEDMQ